jgi:hypothetical protein
MKKMTKDEVRQSLCRRYLIRLRKLAKRIGLLDWLETTIEANRNGECKATTAEVDMLSRMVDEERISRHEIPQMLGISYRQCNDKDYFAKIRKLRHVGVYNRNDAIILRETKFNKKHLR